MGERPESVQWLAKMDGIGQVGRIMENDLTSKLLQQSGDLNQSFPAPGP